jgi:ferritin-like metal-binding protein YciE
MRSASGKDDGAASSLIEQLKLIARNPRWVGTLRGKSSRPGEQPMTVVTMDDPFLETLKDIYYAEKHIVKALPAMVKKAGDGQLKDALETDREETEGQIERLEEVFKLIYTPARGKKCDAIEGILAEAKKHADIKNNAVGSAQAVGHYEITRYGTLIAWANQLGKHDAARLLEENLTEEKHANELLTKIAESSANRKAAA